MTLRSDGTLSPLFINRQQVIPLGVWLRAESHPTKGFAARPGWHVTVEPYAPHISGKGRVWVRVEVNGVTEFKRPECQGGKWLLCRWLKAVEILHNFPGVTYETHAEYRMNYKPKRKETAVWQAK